ncbi:transposase [Sorangium cellulosum]|uniref:Transposase n=1 Tax=Sorangium cellulosum TaxID=56 RepID=A0A150SKY2_SORCE|nr:transposase [Sorangium cellulosum]KYF93125.1 transposase [Sorangium cellulosum]
MPAPLPMETRVRIASALVKGNSIRAVARMVDVDKGTVMALALRLGEGCIRFHNRMVRVLAVHVIQMDEMWSFVQKKQARVTAEDPAEHGDAYLYVALDANTKLAISFRVGKRDGANTEAFIMDLRSRLTVVPHVTSDGWQPYVEAMAASFRGSADYAQCVKNYRGGPQRSPDHRYEPPRNPFVTKTPIFGAPKDEFMSTSYVERFNLQTRHTVGRTRRLCLAFSKTLRGHRAAIGLGIAAYNWVRVHGTLGTTPAVAAGLTERPWTLAELVAAALAEEETAAPIAQPLKLQPRPGETPAPARALPNGRGFLRLVDDGKGAPAAPVTPPAAPAVTPVAVEVPAAASVAPVAPAPVVSTAPDALPGQLDLLSWRPKAREAVQLELFGDEVPDGPRLR